MTRKPIEVALLAPESICAFFEIAERRSDKLRLYNFSQVARERLWLRDVLVTDSEDSEDTEKWNNEERIRHLLYYHQLRRKYQKRYYSNPEVITRFLNINLYNSLSASITSTKTKVGLSEARFSRSCDRQAGGVFGCHVIPVFDENGDTPHANFINEGIMRWF